MKRDKRATRANRTKKNNEAPRCDLPEYKAEPAGLELLIEKVKARAVPDHVDVLSINPTIELVRRPAGPVMIWKEPKTSLVRVRNASAQHLLALKIVMDGISPAEAAASGGVQPGIVYEALDSAVRSGILLAPASLIRRDLTGTALRELPDQDFLSASVFTLQWHITQQCDLRCVHCYDRSDRGTLHFQDAIRILDDFSEFCRLKHVRGQISFSGGNPFLYPGFIDLYGEAAERGFTPAILGNPVPETAIRQVSEIAKPAFFQVSLEGLKKRNDSVRGAGHFERTAAFLKVLHSFDIYSMVMLTLTEDNIDEVIPLCEFLRDRADLFAFNRLAMVGEGAKLRLPSPSEYERFLESYMDAAESNPVIGFKDNLLNAAMHEKGGPLFGGCTGYGCGAAFNFVAVLPDGEVHACRKFPSIIGNALAEGLAKIYDSPAARRYRKGCKACSSCPIRHVCGGCLAVSAGHGLDIFEERDPYCFI